MAKLVGYSDGVVQAMAGESLQQRLQSPLGAIILMGIATGGWLVGSAIGHSTKTGQPLFQVEPSGVEPTDFEEWLTTVVAFAAIGGSVNFVKTLFDEYGKDKVIGYSAGYLGLVFAIKKIKDG
jgi:hypothetical protein